MIDRRTLMKSAALGAAATALPLRAAAETAPSDGEPWSILAPLTPGQALAYGWRLGPELSRTKGAWVLPLLHEGGGQASLHICAHGGVGRGVASTARLDLLLMDGGDGDKSTDEALGRIARYLATVIARNEESVDLRSLMTHGERLFRFGGEGLT